MNKKSVPLETYPFTITETLARRLSSKKSLSHSLSGILKRRDFLSPKYSLIETKSRLSNASTHSRIADQSKDSLLPQINDSFKSCEEFQPLTDIVKKERERPKQQPRVMFNSKVTEWTRMTTQAFARLGEPTPVVPKAKPTPFRKTEPRLPSDWQAKKERASQKRRSCQEAKLEKALQREKDACRMNQRALQERQFHRQEPSSIAHENQICQETRKTVKILIVGAGLSGLSAAHRLLSRNFKNVTIVEALGRPGGRIHSVSNDSQSGSTIELGAPGLHHLEAWNTVYKLAIRNRLIDPSASGVDLGSAIVHTFYDSATEFTKANNRKAWLHSHSLEGSVGSVKQLNDISQHKEINLSYKDYVSEQTRRLFQNMSKRGTSECELSDLAWKMSCYIQDGLHRFGNRKGTLVTQHLDQLDQYSDNNYNSQILRLPGGMGSLFVPLMKNFKKDTMNFNCRVKKIDFSAFEPFSFYNDTDRLVKVTCGNGRVFTAHHVILTCPLGYLKKHASNMFNPPLSESKLKAIERLGFGHVSKVYLHYTAPFWSRSMKIIWTDDISRNEDLCSRDGLIFTFLADDTVVEVAMAGTYLEDVCDGYLTDLLTSVMGSYFQIEISKPEKITRSYWSTSPLFGGTHPFISKTSSKKDVEELATPICCRNMPIVMFAGDATHKSYTCLTHAARASGLREAMRIEAFYDELFKYKNKNGRDKKEDA